MEIPFGRTGRFTPSGEAWVPSLVRFTGSGGTDRDREATSAAGLEPGRTYPVEWVEVGSFSSHYSLGASGVHNTTMFEDAGGGEASPAPGDGAQRRTDDNLRGVFG